MTGPFENLIYTDCLPRKSVSGAAGLQFQSRSPGADENAMTLVRQSLLYEAPETWMRDRRPVTEYPSSFSHAVDRAYTATAAGIYLGREVSGGREGNQLTHSIVTRDAESYGPYRPAQLYGASFWVQEAAENTTMPRLEAGWTPGSLDIDQLAAMVRNRPDGRILLASLLSAFNRCLTSASHRVMFVSDDCGEVVKWIAAATLLLPQKSALVLGFKVFTTDPARARQPIVAVHSGTPAGSGTIATDRGYGVFDLGKGLWSQVEVEPSAFRNVDLFLSEDPYDVVDAIEIAAHLTGKRNSRQAWSVGAAIALRQPPHDDNDALRVVEWLRDGDLQLRRAHTDRVLSVIVPAAEGWPWHILMELVTAVQTNQVSISDVVRLDLLALVIRRAEPPSPVPLIEDSATERLFSASYSDAASAQIREALTSAVDEQFALLLEVAQLFSARFSIAELPSEVAQFVSNWADRPGKPYQPSRWVCEHEMIRALTTELDRQIAGGAPAADLARQWQPLLDRYVLRVDTQIGAAILSIGLQDRSTSNRAVYIRRRISDAGQNIRFVNATARALWRNVIPTREDVQSLHDVLPPGVRLSQDTFEAYAERILATPSTAGRAIDTAALLISYGRYDPAADIQQLLKNDDAIRSACGKLARYVGPLPGPAAAFESLDRRLLQARLPVILEAVLSIRYPPLIVVILNLQPTLAEPYFSKLIGQIGRLGQHYHVVAGFYFAYAPPKDSRYSIFIPGGEFQPTEAVRNQIEGLVHAWVLRTIDRSLLSVATSLVARLGLPWTKEWEKLIRERRGRFGRRRSVPL